MKLTMEFFVTTSICLLLNSVAYFTTILLLPTGLIQELNSFNVLISMPSPLAFIIITSIIVGIQIAAEILCRNLDRKWMWLFPCVLAFDTWNDMWQLGMLADYFPPIQPLYLGMAGLLLAAQLVLLLLIRKKRGKEPASH